MKVAVIGSRSFRHWSRFSNALYDFLRDIPDPHFISGGAEGTDSMVQEYAKRNGRPITIYYPDWIAEPKAAGMIRNRTIIEQAEAVLAFWDGVSPGTRGAIELAERMGKKVEVVLVKGEPK